MVNDNKLKYLSDLDKKQLRIFELKQNGNEMAIDYNC